MAKKRIKNYWEGGFENETDLFYKKMEIVLQQGLDGLGVSFSFDDSKPLMLFLSPPCSDVTREINVEDIVEKAIVDGDGDYLKYILKRLEEMTKKINKKLAA